MDPTIQDNTYRGRFAPSPTGPLHFGSLIAALGSWLDARSRGGEWLVRMDDLDRPREVPGSADVILHALEAFGFDWDGNVVYQSSRDEAYAAALEQLAAAGCCFNALVAAKRSPLRAGGDQKVPCIQVPAAPVYHRDENRAPHESASRQAPSAFGTVSTAIFIRTCPAT